jgi:AcrR family transcriptional regulator
VLRGQILDKASRLFYERGFDATSIRDIAEAVKISSSTMYHHFATKQEVLHEIVRRFMTDFVEATLPALRDESLSATERIRLTIAKHIEISDERRAELLIGNPIRYALNPAQRELGIKLQAAYHDAVRDTIMHGCRTGEFTVADVSLVTLAILDMLNGIREWFSPGGRLTRAQIIDRYTGIVMTILGARSVATDGAEA